VTGSGMSLELQAVRRSRVIRSGMSFFMVVCEY